MNSSIRPFLTIILVLLYTINVNAGITEPLLNDDRNGYNSFLAKDYDKAQAQFTDNHWKGIAALKGREFDAAISHLKEVQDSIHGKYNLATAYALSGDLENALEKYQEVLDIDPSYEDARYNLKVVKEMQKELKKSSDQGQSKDGKEQNKKSKDKQQSKSKEQKDDQKSQEGKGNSQKNDAENKMQSKDEQNKQDIKAGKSKDKIKDKDKKHEEKQQEGKVLKDNKENSEEQEAEIDSENTKKKGTKSTDKEGGKEYDEKQQAIEQWLRSIQPAPGGLLKRKFKRDYQDMRSH